MPNVASSHILVGQELENSPAQLDAQAQAIEDELTTLANKLQPMIEAWAAQSATEYNDLMNQWNIAATGLFGTQAEGGVLGTIAAALGVNWTNYWDAEQANISTWQHT
jgi:uncharacterized protein YukE